MFYMGQMISLGTELIRINPQNNHIEYSVNGGRTWLIRFNSPQCGVFQELTVHGSEILATTSKGLFYSKNAGRNWLRR